MGEVERRVSGSLLQAHTEAARGQGATRKSSGPRELHMEANAHDHLSHRKNPTRKTAMCCPLDDQYYLNSALLSVTFSSWASSRHGLTEKAYFSGIRESQCLARTREGTGQLTTTGEFHPWPLELAEPRRVLHVLARFRKRSSESQEFQL